MKRRAVVLTLAFAAAIAACAPNRGDAYTRSIAEARRASHAGRFEEAAARYAEAARTAKIPRDGVFARYQAALALARAGDTARASAELRAIASADPPSEYAAPAAFKAAQLALPHDEARAYAELEAMALRFPESGVARVALERVFRRDDEIGGPAQALAHAERVAPKVEGTSLAQIVLYARAKRLAELERHEEALAAFLEIARRWPYPFGVHFDDALYRASEMDEKLGRPRKAVDHLERLLRYRETADLMGSYERPRYVPAILRIADLHERALGDRARARDALHRLYRDFKFSTLRDDALWREAELWTKDGDSKAACARLSTLARDFPDSRYVPCATLRCPSITRPKKSKAPETCRGYIQRGDRATIERSGGREGEDVEETP
jgi:tetratricopeptide (TPR) repeat protein